MKERKINIILISKWIQDLSFQNEIKVNLKKDK